jgi:hypothetical protein
MELLDDAGLLEANFGPFRDSVNLHVTYVHGLGRTYYMLGNYFGYTQWNS